MICFQISIFEPLETTRPRYASVSTSLWFAFKLVSLNHWKQPDWRFGERKTVVICFQISIFEPLETTGTFKEISFQRLWFAFKLVSLNHWKQLSITITSTVYVVICFQISIFEPLETTWRRKRIVVDSLWFAFKLVSLNHWKQLGCRFGIFNSVVICFQISIFEPLETTIIKQPIIRLWLWFAFKLVSLNHWKQQWENVFRAQVCCDLLSN